MWIIKAFLFGAVFQCQKQIIRHNVSSCRGAEIKTFIWEMREILGFYNKTDDLYLLEIGNLTNPSVDTFRFESQMLVLPEIGLKIGYMTFILLLLLPII